MAVVSIRYNDGGDPLNYESVEISYGDSMKEKKVFNSGNFIKDWFDCNKFIIFELSDKEAFFSHSSSVDHFIMDGAPYRSAYLKQMDTKKDDEWFLDYGYDHQNQGTEFFVPEGTKPTWEELKAMCGHVKKES